MRTVQKRTTQISSAADGLPLSVLEIYPDEKPWCLAQIIHGMCEYKERYEPLMEFFARRGIACVIHDHRGHGKSVYRENEDFGYMYGGGADALVADAWLVTAYLRRRWGKELPLTLVGHSMGSLVARCYLKKYDHLAAAAILCGSPSRNPFLKLGQAIVGLEGMLLGPRHKSLLMQALTFGPWAARFPQEKRPCAWICTDPKVVDDYEASNLCGFPFTVDGYRALLELMGETYSGRGWRCQNPDLPILFISGGDDPCMGNVRKFKQALDAMRLAGYRNVRGKIYPNLRHELFNEPKKEKIYRNCYCFIREKLV